jgi:acyl dehydratase
VAVELFLEDFAPGRVFRSHSSTRMESDRIIEFASEFDPQPFHLDPERARDTMFGGLVASGWHTAGVTMQLLVESDFAPAGGIIGAGFEDMRWPRPVNPGDTLRVEAEVLETRPSRSRPQQGLLKLRINTFNQRDEIVQTSIANILVQARPTDPER